MSEIREKYNLESLPQIVTDQAMKLASEVLPPLCEGGKIIDAKFAPYHIGSSPGGVIHYTAGTIQTWTQLPRREDKLTFIGSETTGGVAENMYNQFGWVMRFLFKDFVHFDSERQTFWIDTESFGTAFVESDERIAQVYSDWEIIVGETHSLKDTPEQILDRYKTPAWATAGLYYVLGAFFPEVAPIIKGQFTGPVTWGVTIKDQSGRSIIFDEQLYDVLARVLILQGIWQLRQLEKFGQPVIIHGDEPALTSASSGICGIPNAKMWLDLMLSAFRKCNLGVHVCGTFDYDILVKAKYPPRIISLDLTGPTWDGKCETALYGKVFTAWAKQNVDELNKFLSGGFIALGVIPYNTSVTANEIVTHTRTVLDQCIQAGVMLTPAKCFITPTCGAGSQPIKVAQDTFEKLVGVSYLLQQEYRLDR